MNTQCEQIKGHLQSGLKITALDALNQYGCFRLASRISDLKKTGLLIASRKIKTETGKYISEYYI